MGEKDKKGWREKEYYVANSAKCYVLIITYGHRSQPSLPSIEQTRHALPLSSKFQKDSASDSFSVATLNYIFSVIKLRLRATNRLLLKPPKYEEEKTNRKIHD